MGTPPALARAIEAMASDAHQLGEPAVHFTRNYDVVLCGRRAVPGKGALTMSREKQKVTCKHCQRRLETP